MGGALSCHVYQNNVLPAWGFSFQQFLFLLSIYVLFVCEHLENNSFTCMGAHSWRNQYQYFRVLAALRFPKKSNYRLAFFFCLFFILEVVLDHF